MRRRVGDAVRQRRGRADAEAHQLRTHVRQHAARDIEVGRRMHREHVGVAQQPAIERPQRPAQARPVVEQPDRLADHARTDAVPLAQQQHRQRLAFGVRPHDVALAQPRGVAGGVDRVEAEQPTQPAAPQPHRPGLGRVVRKADVAVPLRGQVVAVGRLLVDAQHAAVGETRLPLAGVGAVRELDEDFDQCRLSLERRPVGWISGEQGTGFTRGAPVRRRARSADPASSRS